MGRSTLAAFGALALAAGASGFLTPSSPLRLASKHANGASCFGSCVNHHDLSMMSDSDGVGQEERQARQLTRQGWLQTATAVAAVAAQTGVAVSVSPDAASAATTGGAPNGLPASGYFVQHAVFKVQNIEEEIKFYTQGLGMKVVRQREVNGARNVFVSYGEESLRAKDGGYFSLELVYDPKAPIGYSSGGPFQYLGITLPSTLAMVAYKTDDAGGTVVPHWFGTRDFMEVTSPCGTTVRVKEGKRRDPFSVLAFGTQYPDKTRAYFHDVLGMKDQDAGLLKILGPLAGDANRLSGYDRNGVSVALNPVETKISEGGIFGKLAILTSNTKAVAERVTASGGTKNRTGGEVLFAGEVPGIGTKVANTIDFEGRGVVFVDYEDFEGEMKPSS